MGRKWIIAAALLFAASPCDAVSLTRQTALAVQTGYDPQIGLASFDSAWMRIQATHYDPAFNGIDWAGVRGELRPAAERASTNAELRAVIRDMLARLGESHYTLIPADVADAVDPARVRQAADSPGEAGLELRLAEDELVVWRVDAEGPAAAAGIRPGHVVLSIDAFEPRDAIRRITELKGIAERRKALTQFLWSVNARAEGPAGSTLDIRVRDAAGRGSVHRLSRRVRAGNPVRFGNLPTFFAQLSHETIGNPSDCIGVIRFNVWMVPLMPAFDRAMDAVRGCSGIILDLRGNPGGVAGMVMGLSGHFLNERVALGTMRSRGNALNFVANPRLVDASARPIQPFSGPLAILIDPMSVSTSEIFAGGMQALGRAKVFGETSAGQALPAALLRLPNGDVLMHVVADFTAAGGTRIEGRGVVPDEAVALTRADLDAGRDAPREAAIAWIRSQPRD
jgi:carboxyl-terminal processing protease